MKQLKFTIKYDEEFKDYYFQPFKNKKNYVWINDILEDDKHQLVAFTDYGFIPVYKIDWENMKVICNI